MGGYRLDCEFCDETLTAEALDELKRAGQSHLEAQHYEHLAVTFADAYGGEPCGDDCGYVFPVDGAEAAGFDCPNCGYDHFSSFAKRYLYWRIADE